MVEAAAAPPHPLRVLQRAACLPVVSLHLLYTAAEASALDHQQLEWWEAIAAQPRARCTLKHTARFLGIALYLHRSHSGNHREEQRIHQQTLRSAQQEPPVHAMQSHVLSSVPPSGQTTKQFVLQNWQADSLLTRSTSMLLIFCRDLVSIDSGRKFRGYNV